MKIITCFKLSIKIIITLMRAGDRNKVLTNAGLYYYYSIAKLPISTAELDCLVMPYIV